ncbi:MAG: hypothetical protein K8R21_01510 [Leptospira sp.]|nr:hypothetical protein [Leptospira sp.]
MKWPITFVLAIGIGNIKVITDSYAVIQIWFWATVISIIFAFWPYGTESIPFNRYAWGICPSLCESMQYSLKTSLVAKKATKNEVIRIFGNPIQDRSSSTFTYILESKAIVGLRVTEMDIDFQDEMVKSLWIGEAD